MLSSLRSYGSRSAISIPTETLIEKLREVLGLVPRILLVIDGVDQLKNKYSPDQNDSATELISTLCEISGTASVSVILLTQHRDWLSPLMAGASTLDITRDVTNADIDKFVSSRAARSLNLFSMKDEVMKTIRTKGSGDFHFASLLMQHLEACKSPADQERALREVPHGLENLYKKLDGLAMSRLNLKQRLYRRRMLCMVYGTQVPFTPAQINCALVMDHANDNQLCSEQWFDPIGTIADIGDPFIVAFGHQVAFNHDTARSYVIEKSLVTKDDSNADLLDICLAVLTDKKYVDLAYCAHKLEQNLFDPRTAPESEPAPQVSDLYSELYDHATLYWHTYALQLSELTPELWKKLETFLFGNGFVSWAEKLFILTNRGGLDPHLQRLVAIANWYGKLQDKGKPYLPIEGLFLQPYHDISVRLESDQSRPELQYLPLIRMSGYLNNGGQSREDFERAQFYAEKVATGFKEVLGPRNRNTLNARLAYNQGLLALNRPDEALIEYQEVLAVQKEILDEHDLGIYVTMNWIGVCFRLLARLEESRKTLEEALEGFRRLLGDSDKSFLAVSMGLGNTLEFGGHLERAADRYHDIYEKWIPVNGTENLFAAWILTSYGSALGKQGEYSRAEKLIEEAFTTRALLVTLKNDITVDSGMNLAALFRQSGQPKKAEIWLEKIRGSETFEVDFERLCQWEHIKALLRFDDGEYEGARDTLTRLVLSSTGENRERNNRELNWIRLNLADAARDHGDEDSVPSLFTEIVAPSDRTPVSQHNDVEHEACQDSPPSSSSEYVWLDTPREMKLAEQALRLVRNKQPKDAQTLLDNENLQWVREKDFWMPGGGPKVDTDVIKYRLPRLVDAQQRAHQGGEATWDIDWQPSGIS